MKIMDGRMIIKSFKQGFQKLYKSDKFKGIIFCGIMYETTLFFDINIIFWLMLLTVYMIESLGFIYNNIKSKENEK